MNKGVQDGERVGEALEEESAFAVIIIYYYYYYYFIIILLVLLLLVNFFRSFHRQLFEVGLFRNEVFIGHSCVIKARV